MGMSALVPASVTLQDAVPPSVGATRSQRAGASWPTSACHDTEPVGVREPGCAEPSATRASQRSNASPCGTVMSRLQMTWVTEGREPPAPLMGTTGATVTR